jgi:O-antigen biosynthesis protein WbqV
MPNRPAPTSPTSATRKSNPRKTLIILHDLVMTAVAVLASFYIRFEERGFADRWEELRVFLPAFTLYAGAVYHLFQLYRAKWRFASLPDLFNIVRAVAVLALSLVVLDYVLASSAFYGALLFGKTTIGLYFVMQIVALGAPRLAYRSYRYWRTRTHARAHEDAAVLLAGRATDADVFLRAVESGAIRKVWPVGILSEAGSDRGQSVRGVPVLGRFAALADAGRQGRRPNRLVCLPSAFDEPDPIDGLLASARRSGLSVSRLPTLDAGRALDGQAVRLAPVDVEDLMLRPRVEIDYGRLEAFAKGRAALVTGGGGSIGSEICDRLVSFGVARLLVVESSEPALHGVLEALALKRSSTLVEGRIADVRDRERIFALAREFGPDLVFHAAALKHVPILERDWQEGVKTNVFGSVNVTDAAVAANATALVIISTDKAIEPVSILGATKRLSEIYGQAHDREVIEAPQGAAKRTRIISVRFGNVLASSGSVVPKFKAQIEAGGPVTVTHPDMVRYFMTVREACDLVVTAAAHSLEPIVPPVSVYVLNMGQPVRILDVAERMIRLSGLEPGKDIEIAFTGVRPGERMNEILFAASETTRDIGVSGIVAAQPAAPALGAVRQWLAALDDAVRRDDLATARAVLAQAVPGYAAPAASANPPTRRAQAPGAGS